MTMPLQELMPFKAVVYEQDVTKLRKGVLAKIGGIFQRAETKNANGRIYPKKLWQSILQDPDVKARVENRRMLGMLGHPSSGQTDPEKVALVITKQELRGDNSIYGEAEILDTPMGRIADTMLRAGVGLGISSRGDGSVEKKGDTEEVKDDFKLESYDIVLKPSTPGAYPEMLSESSVDVHETKVAEAIAGLVNGKNVPSSQRLTVLTECLKILSVLEAKNSGNVIHSLTAKITEELGHKALLTVEATDCEDDEDTDDSDSVPEFALKPSTEGTMPANSGRPNLAPDTLAWHQHAVRAAVREAQQKMVKENSQLKDVLVKAQREHNETRKRLRAAESLIEDFSEKIRRLKESAPADRKLARRYEAAVELLDEALKRLPEIGSYRRRCKTLEGLVQAGFDHVLEERLNRSVKEHLAQVSPVYHATIRPVLENCKTPEQVAETFKALAKVSGNAPSPSLKRGDPLPGLPSRRGVREDRSTPSTASGSKTYTGLLANRLAMSV